MCYPTYFRHVVLGGGIVGLSISARLASLPSSYMTSTLLLERRSALLQETSSHNSGVVHAGLYYPKDSLKTKLCIEGNKWIWDKVLKNSEDSNFIHAKKCGKWIIASCQEEVAKLESLQKSLQDRGMPFRWVSKKERQEKEPELECVECLESVDTGIIDVHSLANYFERAGKEFIILKNYDIKEIRLSESGCGMKGLVLQLILDDENETCIETNCLINATGLFASKIAEKIRRAVLFRNNNQEDENTPSNHLLPPQMIQKLARGSYVTLSGKQPLSRLVYPCPLENLSGLGVHSVIDLSSSSDSSSSQLLFGPNVEFLSTEEQERLLSSDSGRYALPPTSTNDAFLDSVHTAVKKYLPNLQREKLRPAFCGIRPKLSGKGESFRDFFLEMDDDITEATRGDVKVVNCLGIESPGLTASPAIGRYVVEEVLKMK